MFRHILNKKLKTMKGINTDFRKGRQNVVFDQVDATIPGGVHIDKTEASARFTDGVIPAGTVVVPHTNGTYKPINAVLSATNVKDAVGLTMSDIVIDDYPLVSIVVAGTVRVSALPDKEKAGAAFLKAALPRITQI
uniref:Uncharacterized protein n=1 Tax=Siphoviridae sp. ctD4R19 TaxID=2823568 RepID=A0A8S5L654_9CAUD|nr:MAG TPA: hypothetical protein [Siphoviridae sp. ctD4R19]DAS00856.1 MAG TPA: hypothetical protein [Caudoviricetes sp.]